MLQKIKTSYGLCDWIKQLRPTLFTFCLLVFYGRMNIARYMLNKITESLVKVNEAYKHMKNLDKIATFAFTW